MRTSFLLFFLVAITLFSCTQNQNDTIVATHSSGGQLYLTSADLQVSSLVDGDLGGDLIFDQSFVDNAGRNISVYAHLTILPNAFSDSRNITMILDPDDASIRFLPHITFASDVSLDLKFTGLDLLSLGYASTGNVDFIYFNDNGTTELIENNTSKVKLSQNLIMVQNAKLLHFSRYGWVR